MSRASKVYHGHFLSLKKRIVTRDVRKKNNVANGT